MFQLATGRSSASADRSTSRKYRHSDSESDRKYVSRTPSPAENPKKVSHTPSAPVPSTSKQTQPAHLPEKSLESVPIWEDYMPDLSREIRDLQRIVAQAVESGSLKKKKKKSAKKEKSSSSSNNQSSSDSEGEEVKAPAPPAPTVSKKSKSKKILADLVAAQQKHVLSVAPTPKRKPTPAQKKKLILGLAKRLTQALEDSI